LVCALINCREQPPTAKQQTEESPTRQPDLVKSSSQVPPATSDSIDTSPKSNVLYAHIEPSKKLQDSEDHPVYENAAPSDDRKAKETLIYSDLLSKDNLDADGDDTHIEAPSGELYAQVQK